jgi:dihydroorotate dehydrogenase (NAD+) catalytic subunit
VNHPGRPGIAVFGTTFQNPVLLSAGTAGFGREVAGVIALTELGGIVTKAVSPEPRAGHPAPRVAEFPGGMLNAVGLANPGLEYVVERELPWLERHAGPAKVIVNVVGSRVDDFVTVARKVSEHAVVAAVELNVSCPNTERGGLEFGADAGVLSDLVRRCRGATDRPVIVKLAPNLTDLGVVVDAVAEAGAAGFTLFNTMPGTLSSENGGGGSRLGFGRGGVSGPGLLPVGVLATATVTARTGLPVIGVGGIRSYRDACQYLDAGASLVAVGTAALANPRIPARIARDWSRHG